MRILHILDHSPPVQSGYVYRTLAILREQVAAGWQVLALTTPKQPTASHAREIVDGWEFIRTPGRPRSRWLPQIASEYAMVRATIGRLEEIAREWRPSVLHAHSPVPNAWAALSVGRRLGLPVVYEIRALWEDAASSHGTMTPGSLRYAMARHLETRAARRADALVTICRGLYDDLSRRGVCQEHMFIVPNAADVASLLPDASMGQSATSACPRSGDRVHRLLLFLRRPRSFGRGRTRPRATPPEGSLPPGRGWAGGDRTSRALPG